MVQTDDPQIWGFMRLLPARSLAKKPDIFADMFYFQARVKLHDQHHARVRCVSEVGHPGGGISLAVHAGRHSFLP